MLEGTADRFRYICMPWVDADAKKSVVVYDRVVRGSACFAAVVGLKTQTVETIVLALPVWLAMLLSVNEL